MFEVERMFGRCSDYMRTNDEIVGANTVSRVYIFAGQVQR